MGRPRVFILKGNETGKIIKHKASLVANEYSQRDGINYEKTFSPVAYHNYIRAVGQLEEEVYIELLTLTGAEGKGGIVYSLLQNLYSLIQASYV
ncbi:reverse transcriptase [Phytophthora megakarya]|uniref:Reverse transcriptase n=1 Tax=Phytophthora megakarya TaxID=4795 RepID=A0A225VG87_9STRA|nr:reverse transcriptase [Phytophthora megakarya]